MPEDTELIIRGLAARLWAFPLGEYLASDHFFRFCHAHELGDAWKEFLELSQDIPELYGGAVIKNAFALFLHHVYHTRNREFPTLFARFMMDFCRWKTCDLPVDDLRADLVRLGYADRDIAREFSSVPEDGEDTTGSRDGHCRE